MLAALGVVCRDSSCVRKLHYLPKYANITTRFVIRGGDDIEIPPILYLKTTYPLSKINGPIYSTWKWFQYAIAHYDTAFIGHSEDDVQHYMPALISTLYLTRSRLADGPVAIGTMEIFHYCTCTHQAHFFWSHYQSNIPYHCKRVNASGAYKGQRQFHDNNTRGQIIGPFPILKGPMYFLSNVVVSHVIKNEWVKREWEANLLRTTGWASWDDVFVGMAIAMSSLPDLKFVNTKDLYGESCGSRRKPIHHKPCLYDTPLVVPNLTELSCASIHSSSCSNSYWSSCRLYRKSHTVKRSRAFRSLTAMIADKGENR